jgi:hypothetical protein
MTKLLEDKLAEVDARARASQKLAVVALDILSQIADRLSIDLDFEKLADAERTADIPEALQGDEFTVEQRAAEIVANTYRHLAAERRERLRSPF